MTLVASTKRCFACGDVKNRVEFYRARQNRDGLHGRCKDCTRAAQRERTARRREELGDATFRALQRDANRRMRERSGTEYEKRFNKARTAALRQLADLHRREYEHLLELAKRELDVESTRRRSG